jgi:hypothetical protein
MYGIRSNLLDISTDMTSEPYRVRAAKAIEYIASTALCTLATETCNVPCSIGHKYGFGGRHIVRVIIFDDGEDWIARVGIPAVNFKREQNYIPTALSNSWSTSKAKMMQSDIDTISFFGNIPIFPVPSVVAFDTSVTNTVGAPNMFMECIKGTCAVDMPDSRGDIPEPHKTKFFASEVSILVRSLKQDGKLQFRCEYGM